MGGVNPLLKFHLIKIDKRKTLDYPLNALQKFKKLVDKMIVKKFFFPFLLLFLFPLTAQSKIQSGTLNLKSSKFTEKGLIALKGEWTFYWKKFLSPQD